MKGLRIKIGSKNGILILFDHQQIVKESDSNVSYDNIWGCGDISASQFLRPWCEWLCKSQIVCSWKWT